MAFFDLLVELFHCHLKLGSTRFSCFALVTQKENAWKNDGIDPHCRSNQRHL